MTAVALLHASAYIILYTGCGAFYSHLLSVYGPSTHLVVPSVCIMEAGMALLFNFGNLA